VLTPRGRLADRTPVRVDERRGATDAWEHAKHAVVLLLPYTLSATPGLGALRFALIVVALALAPVVAVRAHRAGLAAQAAGRPRRPYAAAVAIACLVPVPAIVTLLVWRTIDPGAVA